MPTFDKHGRTEPMTIGFYHKGRPLVLSLPYTTRDPELIRLLKKRGLIVVRKKKSQALILASIPRGEEVSNGNSTE